ncbi:MAG: hypothetical protein ACYTFO_11905, partial [Planctomycetota bacterium]
MIAHARRRDAGFILAAVLVAVYFVGGVIWRRAQQGQGTLSHDLYSYSYPMFIYAQDAWQRGEGLLWNDFQNCGQPFFGIISTALLYPVNTLFLSGDLDLWLYSQAVFHLSLAGIGIYLLCRELGLERTPAFCGALAFQLGGVCRTAVVWSPAVLGPYAWLPLAMFLCERILRTPRPALGVGLGAILTLQMLAGLPLVLIFTYQLIALRLFWEMVSRRNWPRARVISVLALGLLLPLLLGAVQLLPAVEVARESVRSIGLTPNEIRMPGSSWTGFRYRVGLRIGIGNLFSVVGVALAGFALTGRSTRRHAWFYLLVGTLYFALVFDTPLQTLYWHVLIACGVAAAARPATRPLRQWAPMLAAPTAAIVAFLLFSPSGFRRWEWLLVVGTMASCGFTILRSWRSKSARVLPALLLACNLVAFAPRVNLSYARDGSLLYQKSDVFSFIQERISAQDRVYVPGRRGNFSLMSKATSVFRVPGIDDYEQLTSRRYAEFYVMMTKGRPMKTVTEWIKHVQSPPRSQPL